MVELVVGVDRLVGGYLATHPGVDPYVLVYPLVHKRDRNLEVRLMSPSSSAGEFAAISANF